MLPGNAQVSCLLYMCHLYLASSDGKYSSRPKPVRPFLLLLILLPASQNAAEKVETKPNARSTIAITSARRTAELKEIE